MSNMPSQHTMPKLGFRVKSDTFLGPRLAQRCQNLHMGWGGVGMPQWLKGPQSQGQSSLGCLPVAEAKSAL